MGQQAVAYGNEQAIKEEILEAWSALGLLVRGQQRSIATILKKKLSRMDFREAGAPTQ